MRCRVAGLLGTILLAGTQPNYVEIKLPAGVASETFFVRYALSGDDLGGWVQPRPGVSSYRIDTSRNGRPAAGIRAILYAPGCAIQTFDLALPPAAQNQRYSFVCQPVSSVSITGAIRRTDRLYGRDVEVQARYVVRWPVDGIATSIPVGKSAGISAGGHFHLEIPDLSQGELQIWAKDKTSGDLVAQLIPAVPGDLKTLSAHPSEIAFAPCAVDQHPHDAYGFAPRPDASDACDR